MDLAFLRLLTEKAANINSGKSLFNFVVDYLSRDFEFDDVVFAKINEDNTHSAFLVRVQETTLTNVLFEEVKADRFPIQDGIANRLMSSEKAIIFDVVQENERMPSLGYIKMLRATGIRSMLAIALRSGDRAIGLLYLQSKHPDSFNQQAIDRMHQICGLIAMAFSNILFRHRLLERQQDIDLQLEVNNLLLKSQSFGELSQVLGKLLNSRVGFDLLGLTCVTDFKHVEFDLLKKIKDEQFVSVQSQFEEGLDPKTIIEEKIRFARSASTGIYTPSQLAELSRTSLTINRKKALFGIRHFLQFNLPQIKKNSFVLTLGRSSDEPFTLEALKTLELIAYQTSLAIDQIISQERIRKLSSRLAQENEYLNEEIRYDKNFRNIIGKGDALHAVFLKVSQVATTSSTVLITGETGTGKELIARAIHDLSPRSKNPFVKLNAAALPEQLIESELFGHEKGSFTGALMQRIGKFEIANGGTIFLDEIGEMPLSLQAKLLRVLQEQEIERIGGIKTINLDVRVIAATNRDLKKEVTAKQFREDLYYRLNVFPVHLPPLRERKDDLEELVRFFIEKFSKKLGKPNYEIPPSMLESLKAYEWPGNIRELEHLIEQSMIMSGDELHIAAPGINNEDHKSDSLAGEPKLTLDELQKAYIFKVLDHTKGKIRGNEGAAALLGIKPTTLESRMKKLGIHRSARFD